MLALRGQVAGAEARSGVAHPLPRRHTPCPRTIVGPSGSNHPEIRSLRVAEINRIDGLHEPASSPPQFFELRLSPGRRTRLDRGRCSLRGLDSADLLRRELRPGADAPRRSSTSPTSRPPSPRSAACWLPAAGTSSRSRSCRTCPETFARSVVLPDGSIEDRAPRICHPGGDVGYPVFTEFGADIAGVFERAGFELDVLLRAQPRRRPGTSLVCRKPTAGEIYFRVGSRAMNSGAAPATSSALR